MNNRIIQFDFLKVFAIFLVCYYHGERFVIDSDIAGSGANQYTFIAYFFHALAATAVPIFFVVNGALMLSKNFTLAKHIKKTFSLLLICIFWSGLTYGLVTLLKGEVLTLQSVMKGIYYIPVGYNNHLWFLRAIILIYLIYPLIKIAFDQPENQQISYFTFAVIFAFSFGNLFLNYIVDIVYFILHKYRNENNVFDFTFGVNPFGNSFYAIGYFLLGGFLIRKDFRFLHTLKASTLSAIFLISWTMLFLYGLMKSHVIGARFDTVYPTYFSLMTIVMTLTLYLLTQNIAIKDRRLQLLIEKVGANTFGIYLIHIPINIFIIYKLPEILLFLKGYWLIGGVIYALILLASSYFIAEGIKKIPYIKRLLVF